MWFPFVGLAAVYCSTVTGAKPLFHLFQHKNTTAPLILLGAVDFRGQKPGIIQSHSIRRLLALVLHIVEVMEFLWLAFDVLIEQIENRTAIGKDHSFTRLVEVRPGPVCAVNDSLAGGIAYLMAFPITSMAGRWPATVKLLAKCQSAR